MYDNDPDGVDILIAHTLVVLLILTLLVFA